MADQPCVADVQTSVWRIPLPRPWGPDVLAIHVIVTEITDDAGTNGSGFAWTPQVGAKAIEALLRDDCVPAILGGPTEPGVVWDRLWWQLHEGGGGGITTIALAAVDLALWDLRGRRLGVSLVDLLGRQRNSVAAYGSGVNLHYSLDELEDQARRWVAAGFGAMKIKVGRADLDEDLQRVAAVRQIIGPRRHLMIDANQRWELAAARRAAQALERFDPQWLEEPLLSDDLRAHAELRRSTSIPIAIGENLYTAYQFREAIALGACDIAQPNAVRVGGITPFLRIAEQCRIAGVGIAPHLLPELSGQLALCLPQNTMVEVVEDASFASLDVLAHPECIRIAAGELTADTGPGHGLALTMARNPDVRRVGA